MSQFPVNRPGPLRVPRAQYPGRAYPYPPVPVYPHPPVAPGGIPPFVPGVPVYTPQPDGPPTMEQPQSAGVGGASQAPMSFKQMLYDPRFTQFMMSVGAQMGQPLAPGQTGWGRMAQALAGGYSTLGMYSAMQEERARQAREEARRDQEETRKTAAEKRAEEDLKLRQAQTKSEIETRAADRTFRVDQFEHLKKMDTAKLELTANELKQQADQFNARLQLDKDKLAEDRAQHGDTKALRERELKLKEDQARYDQMVARAQATRLHADAKSILEETKRSDPRKPLTPLQHAQALQNISRALEGVSSNFMIGDDEKAYLTMPLLEAARFHASASASTGGPTPTGPAEAGPRLEPTLEDIREFREWYKNTYKKDISQEQAAAAVRAKMGQTLGGTR